MIQKTKEKQQTSKQNTEFPNALIYSSLSTLQIARIVTGELALCCSPWFQRVKHPALQHISLLTTHHATDIPNKQFRVSMEFGVDSSAPEGVKT
jgi:hypothetical protein